MLINVNAFYIHNKREIEASIQERHKINNIMGTKPKPFPLFIIFPIRENFAPFLYSHFKRNQNSKKRGRKLSSRDSLFSFTINIACSSKYSFIRCF